MRLVAAARILTAERILAAERILTAAGILTAESKQLNCRSKAIEHGEDAVLRRKVVQSNVHGPDWFVNSRNLFLPCSPPHLLPVCSPHPNLLPQTHPLPGKLSSLVEFVARSQGVEEKQGEGGEVNMRGRG